MHRRHICQQGQTAMGTHIRSPRTLSYKTGSKVVISPSRPKNVGVSCQVRSSTSRIELWGLPKYYKMHIRFHARLCRYPQTPYYCKHCPICNPQGAIVLTQAVVGRDTNTLNKLSTRAFDPTLTITTVAVALTVVTARPGTRDTQTLLRHME